MNPRPGIVWVKYQLLDPITFISLWLQYNKVKFFLVLVWLLFNTGIYSNRPNNTKIKIRISLSQNGVYKIENLSAYCYLFYLLVIRSLPGLFASPQQCIDLA